MANHAGSGSSPDSRNNLWSSHIHTDHEKHTIFVRQHTCRQKDKIKGQWRAAAGTHLSRKLAKPESAATHPGNTHRKVAHLHMSVVSTSSKKAEVKRVHILKDQNTILELSGRVQELQNEVNCMNDSKDFQDAESIRSGNSHVTSRPVSFPPHPISEGMLRQSFVSPSCREGPPSIWDTHGISAYVFANPVASSSAPFPQELSPWSSHISEQIHSSHAVKNENQTPVHDQRCQSGPSTKNSVIPSEGDSSKNYGADQQRLQISDLHFDQIPYSSHVCLLKDKIQDWGMYLFTISYGSYAVDQRSGAGWFSGWIEIFVFCKRNSNARFWSTRREDCFSTEPNHP